MSYQWKRITIDFDDLVQREEIDEWYRKLRDEDLDVLAKVLQESKVLTCLKLGGNQITLSDGKFTDALKENRTLQELILTKNLIGNEGAKGLAEALKVNTTLQKVALDNNQIGIDGAESLAECLLENSSLETLRLDSNAIGDAGAHSLSAALVANNTLEIISLDYNNIGDDGAQSLAGSLLKNESLQIVVLQGNEITDKGAKSLANALRCNSFIEELDLCGNEISDDVEDEIISILADPRRRELGNKVPMLKQPLAAKSIPEEKTSEIARLKGDIALRDEELTSKDGDEELKVSPKKVRPIESSSNTAPSSPADLEGLAKLNGDETNQISLFAVLLAKERMELAKKQVAELENKLRCPVCRKCDEDTLGEMLVFARCGHKICRDCFDKHPRPVTEDSCGWRIRHSMRCHTCQMVVKKTTKKYGIMKINW